MRRNKLAASVDRPCPGRRCRRDQRCRDIRPVPVELGGTIAARFVFALLVTAAVISAPAFAGDLQPTEIVPEAVPTDSPGMYATFGLGAPGGGTDRFRADTPAFAFTFGGSLPINGKAYVDLGMGFSIADYKDVSPESAWSDNPLLETFSLTASVRAGHSGRSVAIYGSAGVGFAYVRLGEPGGFGVYPEPVGSTMAPVLTVAGSLERPVQKHNRFLAELRYSWINADFGSGAGGSLNAGGAELLFGWRHVF